MRWIALLVVCTGLGACSRKEPDASTSPSADPHAAHAEQAAVPLDPACALPVASIISSDLVIKAGCRVAVERSYQVQNGATVTIEAGARLLFQTGTHLWIDYGRLVAKGTAQQPVVFTSTNEKTPVAGEWEGIVFGERTLEGTSLDHAIVEYAGRKGAQGSGAITFYGAVRAGSVSITASILRHDDQAGVHVPPGNTSPLASFSDNTLEDNAGTSLRMPAETVSALGAANHLGEPLRVQGAITRSASWPAVEVPIVVEGPISIEGKNERAVLELAEGTTLRFAKGQQLHVGGGVGGALVAKKVIFTSAVEPAAAGDWKGIVFEGTLEGSSLDGCTFEFAGREGSGVIVLDFDAPKGGVGGAKNKNKPFALRGNTFRNDAGAAFWIAGECGALGKSELGNVSEGHPLCEE